MKEKGIELRPVRLSPEVVEARRQAREKRAKMTHDDYVREIKEERAKARSKAISESWRKNRKEIVLTYAFIFGLLIGLPVIASLSG